jgi:hypothetical protein
VRNVLLVEPAYRSKFPPLGLLRLATYHKERGDSVTFARGKCPDLRAMPWHRVYVSSLFTYELPRTVETIRYYEPSVDRPDQHLIVGGIAATLMPNYIRQHAICRVIEGPLDKAGIIDATAAVIANFIPDYSIVDAPEWQYRPTDSYFCRVSTGCIRRCPFCAVPSLEPKFRFLQSLDSQIRAVSRACGERQHLVLLDNNILALNNLGAVTAQAVDVGFARGALRNDRKRRLDFNQGIDARLITRDIARDLGRLCLDPVRLAFDYDSVEPQYRLATERLAGEGFTHFTNYVMFNFRDDPPSFYRRLRVGIELSEKHGIAVTGFPMRYIPVHDVNRRHVAPQWKWRYLRGIQCILLATHGMVSPRGEFFEAAFGRSIDDFLRIIAMPDRYIVHRKKFKRHAEDWEKEYKALSTDDRSEFLNLLALINRTRDRKPLFARQSPAFRRLLHHYFPRGSTPHG